MGVPKFYRWISERYPCLSEVVKEYQIPEFDNLYLDMNGIIHLCSHPNDDDPHFRITEEKIFADIFHYIECLFRLIKPRKVFFMAVDGVAPRAKMNQQRGRRFRTAREATDAENRAVQRGEVLPREERFDSNCITPGTEFMVKLHEQLKYFVHHKISTDKMWQGLRIYLSGHETPGEGEHKIMDFIRSEKSQPGYDPNIRHCLYGLDADLIMLGMCTHEPHFSLLREEVRFTGRKSQKRTPTPEETTFHLLHLSLLREYLNHEFSPARDKLQFPYELEKIIDDWVLMGFLVGNDFIPHLPHMHIVHGALPTLYKAYREVLPTLDGYINEAGTLNLPRFEKYICHLAQVEYEHFSETIYADLKWLESKGMKNLSVNEQSPEKGHPKRQAKCSVGESSFAETTNTNENDSKSDFREGVPTAKLIDISDGEVEDDDDEDDDDSLTELEFGHHKRDYYMTKLEYANVTSEVLRDQAECFVRAIQWNLHYYYNGVCSWGWFYPHNYAPFISDIKNFSHLKLDFDLGVPFLPYQQLLAVLPAASRSLLPKPYQSLMIEKDSPLIDYYPVDFRTDLNGKQQDWEAIVLIPFIDEKRLLDAMEPLNDQLTSVEKQRNKHGPCLLYTYSKEPLGKYSSSLPGLFPDINIDHALCTEVPMDSFRIDSQNLMKGLCKGVRLDVYFPGFPTLRHIPHKSELKRAEVRVFQMCSRYENMILTIEHRFQMDVKKAAEEFLGKVVHVAWPHMIEAKIVSVSSSTFKYTQSADKSKNLVGADLNKEEANIWKLERSAIRDMYFKRWGVEIGDESILLHATPLIGRKYICVDGGKVTLEKQWAVRPVPYALQTIVKDIQVNDPSFKQYLTLAELFPRDSVCFMLGSPHYGCQGKVINTSSKKAGYIEVCFETWPELNMDSVLHQHMNGTSGYMPGYTAAQKLGISSHLMSCITTTLYVTLGSKERPVNQRFNLGLNLKFNKKNEEVAGYTKKVGDTWLYSNKTVNLVNEYMARFPEMFEYLSKQVKEGNYYMEDLLACFSSKVTQQDMQSYLKSLPSNSVSRQPCGSEFIEENLIQQVESIIDEFYKTESVKTVPLSVRPHLLYKPSNSQGSNQPDPNTTFQILDRVVNVREGFTVPLGYRGTVIAIHMAKEEADRMYDVLFDHEFVGGMSLRCSNNRGYRMPPYALVNITHHARLEQQHHKPTAVVHPQSSLSSPSSKGGIVIQNSKLRKGGVKGNRSDAAMKSNPPSQLSGVHINTKQSGQSAAQVPYPNKINHSPNSPFVVKQGHEQPNERDNEFQDLWHQLRTKGSGTQLVKSSDNNNKGNVDLVNAAKTLPKHPNNRNRNSQYRGTADKGDVTTKRQMGAPPPMPAFHTSKIIVNNEFATMLQALENQPKTVVPSVTSQTKSNPVKFFQEFQIHGSNEKSKTKVSNKESDSHNAGSKITVEQLFQETRESEQQRAKQQIQKGARQTTREKVASGEPRVSLQDDESYVAALQSLTQKLQLGKPLYEHIKLGPAQSLSARVLLPDGSIHYGGMALTEDEAVESAAKCAYSELIKLLQNQPPLRYQGPPLSNMTASAAQMTGVPMKMSAMQMRQPHASQLLMQPRMPHPLMQRPASFSAYPQARPGFLPTAFQGGSYPIAADPYYAQGISMNPQPHPLRWPLEPHVVPSPHPEYLHDLYGQLAHKHHHHPNTTSTFVPLQVTKQKMTPKKGGNAKTSTKEKSEPAIHEPSQPNAAPSSHHKVEVPPLHNSATIELPPATKQYEEKTTKATGPSSQAKPKRKSKASRLAINFQPPADS